MSFSKFINTVTTYIDPVADFLLGEEVYSDDAYETGSPVSKSRQGGFLSDLFKKGSKAYVATMQADKDDPNVFQATKFQKPDITRFTGQAPRSPGLTQGAQILGGSDPRVQSMLRNLSSRTYASKDMSRIQNDIKVAMNLRQGRRTQGIDAAKIPQAKEMDIAKVRKQAPDTKVT
tara:strand:+ start:2108 stop:2632 length:525 start_codon:yes stop_codon:yes gene_type:complete